MSQTHLIPPARKERTDLPQDVWDEIAEQYENNISTTVLAEHYDLDISTINKRMARDGRRRRGPGPLRPAGADPVASLEEARNATIAGMLNAFNDNAVGELLLFAKVAAILDRIAGKPGKSPANHTPTDPVFTPLPDIIAWMQHKGLTYEDVERDGVDYEEMMAWTLASLGR